MRKTTKLIILAVVTVVVVVAAALTRKAPVAIPRSGELMFPDLISRINDTSQVAGVSGEERFTLERKNGAWVVDEKSDYPAAANEVRRLLLGVAELKRVEAKTRNPKLYAKLDLTDPTAKDTKSVRFSIKKADGDTLASLIVGKQRSAPADPSLSEYYVRLPDDPQAWLVEGKLALHKSATAWLDKQILKIDRARIHRVKVIQPSGEIVTVVKRQPEATDFELLEQPENMQIKSQYTLNSLGTTLADLTLDDVTLRSDLDSRKHAGATVKLETFDGLRVTANTAKLDKKAYIELSAAYDPKLVSASAKPSAAKPSASDEAKKAPASEQAAAKKTPGKPSDGAAKAKAKPALLSADAVKKEAGTLNERWRRWAYEIATYRLDDLDKKLSDLVETKKEPKKGKDS